MTMIGKVRRMHHRQNKSLREIARATSLSRNTVRKYLRVEQLDEPTYRRAAAPTKLTPFHEAIEQALKAGADLYSLSQWLGHRHVSTTSRYLHLARPDAPDGARRDPLRLLAALPPIPTH